MATNILPISDLRRRATGIIKTLREERGVAYITQHGRPAAVLVDYDVYEAMVAQLEETGEQVEQTSAEAQSERTPDSFLTVAQSVDLDGPTDWSSNLDAYLYGGKQIDGD